MKKGFFIFLIVGVVVLWILNKYQTARQLEFTVGLPRNVSVKSGSLTFDLPLTSANVSGGSINIKSADFDIFSGQSFLGKARITEPIKILPATNTTLIAKVDLSFFDLVTAAGGIFSAFKGGKASLALNGVVYAEGFQFPVRQAFDFDTKTLL